MTLSLQKRIHTLVHSTLESYPGAWMVWCDPSGEWGPLLERVASDQRMGGFPLLQVKSATAGAMGGPVWRRRLQEQFETREPFVLYVPAAPTELGWLWAQALLAERLYCRPLREQLVEWGWRPQNLTVSDEEVALLARQKLQQDPAEWGAGGLQPNPELLLQLLTGDSEPVAEQRLILELTVAEAGLPELEEAHVERWRNKVLARLLVTQAHRVAPELIPDSHEQLIPTEHRAAALGLLERWVDSVRLRRSLPQAIMEADRIADLGNQVGNAGATVGPFLSHAAEQALFINSCTGLAQLEGRDLLETLAALGERLERHNKGFWGEADGHNQPLPWNELLRLSRAAQLLLDASPQQEWAAPGEAIDWYVNGGWQMDRAGEAFLRNLSNPKHELLTLITPLRNAFRARWEDTLLRWSDLWVAAGCPVPDLRSAGAWVREVLQDARPTAVLTVDALRYDVGAALAEEVNRREGANRAVVRPARAPLPSITPLGMAMALPIPEEKLVAEVEGGKWQIVEQGRTERLDIASQRRGWWQQRGGVPEEAILTLADLQRGTLPQPAQGCTRLVIYDATLDKLGHDDQLEALGSDVAQSQYLTAIQQLRDAGWRRILVVTDHGYIHWSSSSEKTAPLPAPDPAYLSRRAAAYPAQQELSGPQALAPGGRWRVALPYGPTSFRNYGSAGYFHGGASLQEWIIPCIQIEWPLEAKAVRIDLEPLPRLLSQQPRVTLHVGRETLFIEEALPRQVEVLIRHATERTILFRSGAVDVTPDQQQVEVKLDVVDEAEAARGTPLRIEVRDTRTEEVLASGESSLMVELTGW